MACHKRRASLECKARATLMAGIDDQQLNESSESYRDSITIDAPISEEAVRSSKRPGGRRDHQRLSKGARFSTTSSSLFADDRTQSPRLDGSSKTQRASTGSALGLNTADFDLALQKFALGRESFLADLSLNAAVDNGPVQARKLARAIPRPKSFRPVYGDEVDTPRSNAGSVRRRLSSRRSPLAQRQASCKAILEPQETDGSSDEDDETNEQLQVGHPQPAAIERRLADASADAQI